MPDPAPKKVLVVDDDEAIVLVVQTLLLGAGYEPVVARDGREALELAPRVRPDLVLLDVMMPRISGWEVCATLKALPETASIPVVMLTVKSDIKDLVTGMQVGADDYVGKPFTRQRLLETVARALEGGGESRIAPALPHAPADPRARSLVLDAETGLPTVPLVIDTLRDRLLVDQDIGVLYIDFEKYSHIEDSQGWVVFDEVLREGALAVRRLLGTVLSAEDIVAVNRPAGSDFYVFVTMPPGLGPAESIDRLMRKARHVEVAVGQHLNDAFRSRIQQVIGLYVGWARIRHDPQVRLERLVHRGLREAVAVAASKEGERAAVLREQFRDVLVRKRIDTVFQPIVDLATGEVVGHEALSRGPEGTPFQSPEVLFDYALRTDQVWSLERLCMASAARRFRPAGKGLLFVNVETELVHDLKLRGHEVLEPLRGLGTGVVLEITERAAIRDFGLFRESVALLKSLGFEIAIDDAGSGYASLQAIAELRPAYLKVSNTLVTGLPSDGIKRDVVEMLVQLASRIDSRTVAEGIETEAERAELRRLGVSYGQGFLLGRPARMEAGEGEGA